ncbi:MAG: GDP-L-fucose synthase [Betaproteobacteria bacterium SG8_40]|nr:MAG: GDP-L-fucose synthase [Betaproteobacteria bacterium SG8_40]
MRPESRIYVAGHRGLAGSAIVRRLRAAGFTSILTRTHDELDLTDQRATSEFFERNRPEYVFLAAAKVGGIVANDTYPADFIQQNLAIQTNVIHQSWRAVVKRLLFLGSSCIYPRDCPQPMKEAHILTGPLESTNRPYAIAKIAGIEMCSAYNRQFGTQFIAAMPTNLYGPGDNYNLETSHVLPALIRKMLEAKRDGKEEVVVWGTGKPRREFLHSDDMADACVHLMSLGDERFDELSSHWPPLINIGYGSDLTIRETAELVASIAGFQGRLVYDSKRPDGTPRKLLDCALLSELGWKPKISLQDGIKQAMDEFLAATRAGS